MLFSNVYEQFVHKEGKYYSLPLIIELESIGHVPRCLPLDKYGVLKSYSSEVLIIFHIDHNMDPSFPYTDVN